MNTIARTFLTLGLCALAAAPGRAQVDPEMAKIRHLLDRVQEGMQEIDKLLLQSASKTNAAAAKEAAERTSKRLDELLKQLKGSQDNVGQDLQKLIEEIERMQQKRQNQQQSSSGDGDGQGRSNRPPTPEDLQDQQRSQQQNQNETPEMVDQQQKQKDDQRKKEQRQQNGEPHGVEKDHDKGQNTQGTKPPGTEEEKAPRVLDNQRWGMLPKYLEFIHSRGGMPDVPEKYRRYYEAFLKEDAKTPPPEKR